MTRDRNRKKAVRAAAAATAHGSYQRTLHDNPQLRGPGRQQQLPTPTNLTSSPALGVLTDGIPYRTHHNLLAADADAVIAMLAAAAAFADSLQRLTIMIFDVKMQLVDVADTLTRHGFSVSYACDPRGYRDLLDELRAAITQRRDDARAQGIKANGDHRCTRHIQARRRRSTTHRSCQRVRRGHCIADQHPGVLLGGARRGRRLLSGTRHSRADAGLQ